MCGLGCPIKLPWTIPWVIVQTPRRTRIATRTKGPLRGRGWIPGEFRVGIRGNIRGGHACRGLTLIEVVASLALLGGLLTAMVMAHARHVKQLADADRQMNAVAAADALLTQWWQDPASFPIAREGTVPNHPRLAWRTEVVTRAAVEQLGGQVVRLEIHEQPPGSVDAVLVAVDLVLAKRTPQPVPAASEPGETDESVRPDAAQNDKGMTPH